MKKTAAELMAELQVDEDFQAMQAEKERELQEKELLCREDEASLIMELEGEGVSVCSVWDFVNSDRNVLAAVPVLKRHLELPHHPKTRSGIIRALCFEELQGDDGLWRVLLKVYRSTKDDSKIPIPFDRGVRRAAAVTLETLATADRVVDLETLVEEFPSGDGMLFIRDTLSRFTLPPEEG